MVRLLLLEKHIEIQKKKRIFYSIFDNATENEKFNNSDEANYVMAMLVRGGVFGDASK